MTRIFKYFTLLCAFTILSGAGFQVIDQEGKRPFYEYKGNYRDNVNALKQKFKDDFGYDLVDMDRDWNPDEITALHKAFSELPQSFYRLPGVEALYRLNHFMDTSQSLDPEEVSAAVLPSFMTLYSRDEAAYKVLLANQQLRVEFYNSLFYEDTEDFVNIVQHEMAHALDVSRRFLSFSPEWIAISHFKVLHLFALDGGTTDDFLFSLVNDPEENHYAPTANRHLPTYSRQSPQEDFANAVAGYIHYPYFRYTHPGRYAFLKEKVFGGKEYFPADRPGTYADIILEDWAQALNGRNWEKLMTILKEIVRDYRPAVESKMFEQLQKVVDSTEDMEVSEKLGVASCYFTDPRAVELIRKQVFAKKVAEDILYKDARCRKISRKMFEEGLVSWPLQNLYFYRDAGSDFIQFLDPVLLTAYTRGFSTRYNWTLFIEGDKNPWAKGSSTLAEGGNGSVKIDLGKTSSGTYSRPPDGQPLILEVNATRFHVRNFKSFDSQATPIRFVTQPWQVYTGPASPEIRIVYPLSSHYKDFQ